MRLQATDEDVYRIMDRQEKYLLAFGAAVICTAASLYVFLSVSRSWENLYLLLASFAGTFYFLYQVVHLGRQIMEMKSCYMEVTEESLVVWQAGEAGHYEACRIFLDEIEKIVEGSRRGIPEFYVVMNENAKESFLLLDDKERKGRIFLVKSWGYQTEEFRQFYRTLRWQLPGKARIVGTKEQTVWEMKKPQTGFLLGVGIALLYLIPKLCILIL